MKHIAFLLALIQAASMPPYIYPETDIEQRDVVAAIVIDGDTFRGDDGQSYRLIGINAPEIAHPEYGKPEGEPGGEEAATALRALIEHKSVTAFIDHAHPLDRYGRTVAVIIVGDQDINVEMLRSGLAEPRYLDLSPMIDSPAFLQMSEADERNTLSPLQPTTSAGQSAIRNPQSAIAHLLAPGDRIRVVIGNQTQDFTINPDGEILIKGLGIFRAAGATSQQASASLDSTIHSRGIPAPPTTVFYLAPPPARTQAPRNITVLGAVHRPGTQTAATFVDAVREANPETTADLRNVILDHAGESQIIDAAAAARGETIAPPLTEGDRILIPSRPESAGTTDTPQLVTVLGDVKTPGQYSPGTLTAVLASAGGPTNTARTDVIRVRLPDGHSQTYDLTRITTGRQPDPQLPANSAVYVESNEPRHQLMNDMSTFIGIFSTLALLGLRFGM